MPDIRNYTVEEVRNLFRDTIVDTFAASAEGQAQLNRIAKAITNESLDKRMKKQRETLAEAAFNKELGKRAARNPASVAEFVANKAEWVALYITRKYDAEGN